MVRTWLILSAAAVSTLAAQSAHSSSVQEDATCGTHDNKGCVAPNTAALLQKVFKHNTKSTNVQEPVPQGMAPDADCTGVAAQGRCWFLSDMGQSCAATCAKQGRAFSYTVASADEPLTPRLIGHKPQTKQEPWGTLECYSPSEDRYHPVNQNAARNSADNPGKIGNWTHEECKLACPCGAVGSDKCTWKQPAACVPKFMWKNVEYSGCALVDQDHDKPWCQNKYQSTDNDQTTQDWSYCVYSCEGDAPPAVQPAVQPAVEPAAQLVVQPVVRPNQPLDAGCGWIPAASCVTQFSYKGSQYVGCTSSDSVLTGATPWCSNTANYFGSWSKCVYTCATTPEAPKPKAVYPGDVDDQCVWQPKPACVKTFQYKGVAVDGCTNLDYPTPWCSLDSVLTDSWDTCTRVCAQVQPVAPVAPVDPVPAPVPVPVPVLPGSPPPSDPKDPCYRRSDLENDAIGNTVTLDQVGYSMTAASLSAINMKRFVCRVTAKIGCKVVEAPALFGFVPYWGSRADNNYSSLESELFALCRAEGKWVAPK